MYRILSYSGGKDSIHSLYLARIYNVKMDEIMFIPSGFDYPEILKEIEYLSKSEYNVHILDTKYSLKDYVTTYKRKWGKKKGLPYSFPTVHNRWCIGNIKVNPSIKYYKNIKDNIELIIGYSYSELKRLENYKKSIKSKLPNMNIIIKSLLVDCKVTEDKVLEDLRNNIKDEFILKLFSFVSPLYKEKNRVGCYICPFQEKKGFTFLKQIHPELFQEVVKLEEENYKITGVSILQEGLLKDIIKS